MKRNVLVLAASTLVALTALPQTAQAVVVPQGSEVRVNTDEAHKQRDPAAAFFPNGRSLIVWQDDQAGIEARIFNPTGLPISDELLLAANETLPTIPAEGDVVTLRHPAVQPVGNGAFYAFWTHEDAFLRVAAFREHREVLNQDVYGQRFNRAGKPQGDAFRVNSQGLGLQSRPRVVAHPQGGFLVLWHSSATSGGQSTADGLFARRYDADGAALTPAFKVNTTGGETARNPAVAFAADGSSLIAWEACCDSAERGVFAQLYDAAGDTVGGEFRINGSTEGIQRRPAVAGTADGGYLVAWQGRDGGPFDARIYAQAIDASGAFLGPELSISDSAGNAQISPALSATADGFLVTWLDYDQNYPRGLYGVEVDGNGNLAGSEMKLNETQAGAHYRIGLASDGNGQYLLVWEGFSGDEVGINARRFAGRGQTQTGEYRLRFR